MSVTQHMEQEGIDVGLLFDDLADRLTHTMPRRCLDAQQDGVVAVISVLQCRGELLGMGRHHAVIGIGRQDERGG